MWKCFNTVNLCKCRNTSTDFLLDSLLGQGLWNERPFYLAQDSEGREGRQVGRFGNRPLKAVARGNGAGRPSSGFEALDGLD